MLKVLLADDEKNICLMIKKMVDWESLGMQIIDMVHNGLDAVRVIREKRPDIVITDIRMPGYDGLEIVKQTREMGIPAEFVIISGYRQFEYAHTALTLGVECYLLKPIDKQELEQTAGRIAKKLLEQKHLQEDQKALEKRGSTKQIRQHYLTDILEHVSGVGQLEEKELEEQCGFDQDQFLAIFAKIDTELPDQNLDGLLQMIKNRIEHDFEQSKVEAVNSIVNSGVVTVMNRKGDLLEKSVSGVEKTFQKLLYELEKFRGMHLTVGIGDVCCGMADISTSIEQAVQAVKCRGKMGLDRIILYKNIHYQKADVESLLRENEREFINMIVVLDQEAFVDRMNHHLSEIMSHSFYSPISVYEYCEGILDIFLRTTEQNDIAEEKRKDYREQVQKVMDFCVDPEEIGYRVTECFRHIFEQLREEREGRSARPIRQCETYIREHFAEQISLEQVAEAVCLSPAYLSTLFKKEMGIHFVDYVSSCRMDEAKHLLKDTGYSMTEIAELVGYQDAKYFSKSFHKLVGLKPSAYRKMYSS